MTALAIFFGFRDKPVCEPCLAKERAEKRAFIEALIAEIAERN